MKEYRNTNGKHTFFLVFLLSICSSDVFLQFFHGTGTGLFEMRNREQDTELCEILYSFRVDTTLLGFDQSSWVRGSRTYIFTGESCNLLANKICY